MLRDQVMSHQIRPRDPSLRMNDPAVAIEIEHLVHRAHIEQPRIGGELLPAHRVTRSGDAQALATLLAPTYCPDHIVDRPGRDSAEHARRIEVGMPVVAKLAMLLPRIERYERVHVVPSVAMACGERAKP
jgi:hypothetical protein